MSRGRDHQVAAATAPQAAEFLIRKKEIRKLGRHTKYSRARVRVGPTKYTNQTNGKDLASQLSVSSCVSWAKKILGNRAAARPHTKDTKVIEATSLASQTLSFPEISLLRLKLARLPPRSALPIAALPSISEIPFLDSCFPD